MTALFDYLDAADPWAILAIVALMLFVVTEVGYQYALRAAREANRATAHVIAAEHLRGYQDGYRDRANGKIAGYRPSNDPGPIPTQPETDEPAPPLPVSEVYLREFRRKT
jgi:hypothetical protein